MKAKSFASQTKLFAIVIPFIFLVLLFPLTLTLTAAAQPGGIETSQQTDKTFAVIAQRTSKAVVGIQAERNMTAQQFTMIPDSPLGDLFDEDFLEKLFRKQMPQNGLPQHFKQKAQGSGFIISTDGFILTTSHLVGQAEKVNVKLSDDGQFDGKIIGSDPDSDVALIKIDANNLAFLELANSDQIQVGQWVLAVGSPFGLSHSVTAGIISAKGRSGVGIATYEDFIQTDAAINPGNSGGPLLDLQGKVIGINTAIISKSGGNLGIGLAIPSNMARFIYSQLLSEGKVVRGYLGVTLQDLSDELADYFDMPDTKGVLVPEVVEDSGAAKGGIRKGDIILQIDGKPVEKADELRKKIALLKPGTEVAVLVFRQGKETTLSVELGTRPWQEPSAEQQQPQSPQDSNNDRQIGIEVENLTSQLAERLGYTDKGVVISSVKPGSLAAGAGLKIGMIICEVDNEPVTNIREFSAAIRKARQNDSVLLLVNIGSGNRYVAMKFPKEERDTK